MQIDYRQDPCVVQIFGGHVVCSRPCIGDLKDRKTLFTCHFTLRVSLDYGLLCVFFMEAMRGCSSAYLLCGFCLFP